MSMLIFITNGLLWGIVLLLDDSRLISTLLNLVGGLAMSIMFSRWLREILDSKMPQLTWGAGEKLAFSYFTGLILGYPIVFGILAATRAIVA